MICTLQTISTVNQWYMQNTSYRQQQKLNRKYHHRWVISDWQVPSLPHISIGKVDVTRYFVRRIKKCSFFDLFAFRMFHFSICYPEAGQSGFSCLFNERVLDARLEPIVIRGCGRWVARTTDGDERITMRHYRMTTAK